MSTPKKTGKGKPIDKLTAAERHAIYTASPYFKKKNEDMAAFLKKHPIPKEFLQR